MLGYTHGNLKAEYHYSSLWRLTETSLRSSEVWSAQIIFSAVFGIASEARQVLALVWWDPEGCASPSSCWYIRFTNEKKIQSENFSEIWTLETDNKYTFQCREVLFVYWTWGKIKLLTANKFLFLARFERTNERMLPSKSTFWGRPCHLCVMPTIALAFCSFFSYFSAISDSTAITFSAGQQRVFRESRSIS